MLASLKSEMYADFIDSPPNERAIVGSLSAASFDCLRFLD